MTIIVFTALRVSSVTFHSNYFRIIRMKCESFCDPQFNVSIQPLYCHFSVCRFFHGQSYRGVPFFGRCFCPADCKT